MAKAIKEVRKFLRTEAESIEDREDGGFDARYPDANIAKDVAIRLMKRSELWSRGEFDAQVEGNVIRVWKEEVE